MYLLTSLAFPMEGVVQFKATLFVRKIWFSGLVLFLLPSWVSYGIFLKVGLENSIIWMKIAGFSFYQIKLLYCKVQGFLLKNWIHFASIHVMLYWFWKKNFTIHFLGNLSEEKERHVFDEYVIPILSSSMVCTWKSTNLLESFLFPIYTKFQNDFSKWEYFTSMCSREVSFANQRTFELSLLSEGLLKNCILEEINWEYSLLPLSSKNTIFKIVQFRRCCGIEDCGFLDW